MALGKRILKAREERKLTQAQLAEKVYGSDDPKGQAAISALESRDSLTSVHLFKFADVLNVRARWLQDGELPSGLEDPRSEAENRLIEQLIGLWAQLDHNGRDKVLSYTNTLHAKQHPLASPSNPFGKKRRMHAHDAVKVKARAR